MEDSLMNEDDVRLKSIDNVQIVPIEIKEPKCNLRPFHWYEIVIAVIVILIPYFTLLILPSILNAKYYPFLFGFNRYNYYYSYDDYYYSFNYYNCVGFLLAIIDIILVHCIYKKTFCTETSNPLYCFLIVPLLEYNKLIIKAVILLIYGVTKNIYSLSFFQAFEYVLSIFIWCFSIGFPNEILCRFTVFNVLMDLFRFFKKKVLISLIATSVFTGLTYFLSFYFLYYKGIEYKNVGLLITQIIAGGATGFYYNVIYYLTGNIWITIILNSLSNFNLDYQEQLIIRLDISREYFLTIIYIITYI